MRTLFKAILATGALAAPLCANAIPVYFDLAGAPTSSVEITSFQGGFVCRITDCSAEVSLDPLLGSLSRELDLGDSWTFDFFHIDFEGLGGGFGTISAALGFDSPTGAPTVGSDGLGGFITAGFVTAGSLEWDVNEFSFLLGDGSSYLVTLNDLTGVTGRSATVTATISRPVPEPTTLTLFGLGLLGLGLLRRRRG
jgi:hypothetical protein